MWGCGGRGHPMRVDAVHAYTHFFVNLECVFWDQWIFLSGSAFLTF